MAGWLHGLFVSVCRFFLHCVASPFCNQLYMYTPATQHRPELQLPSLLRTRGCRIPTTVLQPDTFSELKLGLLVSR